MTTVTFPTRGSRILGFTASGHSDDNAEAGTDIVCAAVTSAVRLTETVVNDVLGLSAPVRVDEGRAEITLRLPVKLPDSAEETCQALLTGLMVYFAQLHTEYPGAVEVLEEEIP